MRLICIIIFLQLITANTFAQSNHDPRLIESHDIEYLDRLKSKSPAYYEKLNFYLDHSYSIIDFNEKKFTTKLKTIKVKDIDNINIFLVKEANDIHNDNIKRSYFRIKGTEKILVLEPMKQFNKSFNKARRSK